MHISLCFKQKFLSTAKLSWWRYLIEIYSLEGKSSKIEGYLLIYGFTQHHISEIIWPGGGQKGQSTAQELGYFLFPFFSSSYFLQAHHLDEHNVPEMMDTSTKHNVAMLERKDNKQRLHAGDNIHYGVWLQLYFVIQSSISWLSKS